MQLSKLKDLRRARKISIKDLAKAVGLSRNTVSQIERGKVNPSYESVLAIVKHLGSDLVLSF